MADFKLTVKDVPNIGINFTEDIIFHEANGVSIADLGQDGYFIKTVNANSSNIRIQLTINQNGFLWLEVKAEYRPSKSGITITVQNCCDKKVIKLDAKRLGWNNQAPAEDHIVEGIYNVLHENISFFYNLF